MTQRTLDGVVVELTKLKQKLTLICVRKLERSGLCMCAYKIYRTFQLVDFVSTETNLLLVLPYTRTSRSVCRRYDA